MGWSGRADGDDCYSLGELESSVIVMPERLSNSSAERVAAEPDRQHNNFDLLRLLFASIVVLYHCYDLSLNRAYGWIPHVMSSALAVQGFFAMSGCLIVGATIATTIFGGISRSADGGCCPHIGRCWG